MRRTGAPSGRWEHPRVRHAFVPEAGAQCDNSARWDLCGGPSVRAVPTATIVLALIKKYLNLDLSLFTILQILSVSLLEKTPILQAFSSNDYEIEEGDCRNQLMLFD